MSTTAPVVFDPTPLTEPVDTRGVREWARAHSTSGRRAGASTVVYWVIVAPILAVGALIFMWVLVAMIGMLFNSVSGSGYSDGVSVPTILGYAFFLAVAVGSPILFFRAQRAKRTREYRLTRFATANALTYIPQLKAPALPGMIFGQGHDRVSTNLMRGTAPRFVEFANYTYITGSGKNQSTHRWGYVAIKLDVPLPNIVLDAKGNNSFLGSNLPVALGQQQRLSLEGDFDQHFSLYCPAGYETDALYLFTPDIMARFIDHAAALDVEIVDDWLFLYVGRDAVTIDPATWAWLFATVQALLDKLAQWARWRDERLQTDASASAIGVGAPIPGLAAAAQAAASTVPFAGTAPLTPPLGVAPSGRRLKQGVRWRTTLIVVGVVVVFWLMQSGVMATLLGRFLR